MFLPQGPGSAGLLFSHSVCREATLSGGSMESFFNILLSEKDVWIYGSFKNKEALLYKCNITPDEKWLTALRSSTEGMIFTPLTSALVYCFLFLFSVKYVTNNTT